MERSSYCQCHTKGYVLVLLEGICLTFLMLHWSRVLQFTFWPENKTSRDIQIVEPFVMRPFCILILLLFVMYPFSILLLFFVMRPFCILHLLLFVMYPFSILLLFFVMRPSSILILLLFVLRPFSILPLLHFVTCSFFIRP
jgi:hypothetical protein